MQQTGTYIIKSKIPMKNYPHLYTPANKKASFSNNIKTQKKPASTFGNSTLCYPPEYSKVPSTRTMNPQTQTLRGRNAKNTRISSRSIEQMHLNRSSQDNSEIQQRKRMFFPPGQNNSKYISQFYPPPSFGDYVPNQVPLNFGGDYYSQQSNEQNELFQRSYDKIGQIRYRYHNKNIDHELNEVLQLIKEEKMRANDTLKTLKKTANHYRKICEQVNKIFNDTATNTEEQIQYFKEAPTEDVEVQCGENQTLNRTSSPTFSKPQSQKQSQNGSPKLKIKQNVEKIQENKITGQQLQIYRKLATMLQDMNINSKQILPEQIHLDFQVKNYKNLNESQVIKIQKFFIKKLVEKIPK